MQPGLSASIRHQLTHGMLAGNPAASRRLAHKRFAKIQRIARNIGPRLGPAIRKPKAERLLGHRLAMHESSEQLHELLPLVERDQPAATRALRCDFFDKR